MFLKSTIAIFLIDLICVFGKYSFSNELDDILDTDPPDTTLSVDPSVGTFPLYFYQHYNYNVSLKIKNLSKQILADIILHCMEYPFQHESYINFCVSVSAVYNVQENCHISINIYCALATFMLHKHLFLKPFVHYVVETENQTDTFFDKVILDDETKQDMTDLKDFIDEDEEDEFEEDIEDNENADGEYVDKDETQKNDFVVDYEDDLKKEL